MKKTLLLALVLLLVVSGMGLFAAGQTESAEGKMRVAVSLPPANNAWQARLLDTVLAETAKDTDEFEFTVKNAVDDADQYNMLQTFKDGGYDMIIVLPGNGTLMTPICEEIYDAGIKVMVLDRPIESSKYTVLLAGDNYGAGVNGAKYLGARLGGKGQIAVLRSYVGIPIDLERYNGFMNTLKKEYPGIKVLVEGDGEFNQEAGLKAMSNILPAYPRIDAVFCQDDETAIGALTAIESAKRTDIQFVTGMGGAKNAYDRMAAKDPRYGASMSYFPSMGGDGVRLAKEILRGATFEKDNLSPSYIVTSENVAQYMNEAY
ncbi:MAG: substrate-binding domain-containing protein [Sphaerochaetaceae bacterium]